MCRVCMTLRMEICTQMRISKANACRYFVFPCCFTLKALRIHFSLPTFLTPFILTSILPVLPLT